MQIKAQDRLEALDRLIDSLIGVPYRWGGDDTIAGFDCSGGILELLTSIGLWKAGQDSTAQDLHAHFSNPIRGFILGMGVPCFFGDLVFYGQSKKAITHIGIAIAEGLMFEFGGGGSKTKTVADAIRDNAYGRIRPIMSRNDLVGLVRIHQLQPDS